MHKRDNTITFMRKKIFLSSLVLVSGLCVASLPAYAFIYTNENFHQVPHEQPVHFEQRADGSFWGYTETGREFTQTPIPNRYDVRIHRFAIDEAFFYVTDTGTIFADTDLQALSIYFTTVS